MARRAVNGAAVKAIREALGIPQYLLAHRVGVTKGAVSRIESGAREASPDLIRKLADEMGVSTAAITSAVPEPVAQ